MIATIAICGSMKFFDEMQKAAIYLRGCDFKVFLPEAEESEAFYSALPETQKPALKKKFIDAHLEKIRHSDAVLICNYSKHDLDGYIGPNTLLEIAFAYALSKRIFVLNNLAKQPCKDEVEGLGVIFLNSDLSKLPSLQKSRRTENSSHIYKKGVST